ncbi:hypothetical protein J7413_14265 [Shimia sp. R10_1]|uniref:hypothetical protein n=1 Tax=Shimia sp. R10_1 TaxID=2821095 RepID=UPI001ADB67FE|nr:hypothetical protein [Shimia sp. R10_1]MBO9474710.1 hypothetical protein [Shimia sp. R10_1]
MGHNDFHNKFGRLFGPVFGVTYGVTAIAFPFLILGHGGTTAANIEGSGFSFLVVLIAIGVALSLLPKVAIIAAPVFVMVSWFVDRVAPSFLAFLLGCGGAAFCAGFVALGTNVDVFPPSARWLPDSFSFAAFLGQAAAVIAVLVSAVMWMVKGASSDVP